MRKSIRKMYTYVANNLITVAIYKCVLKCLRLSQREGGGLYLRTLAYKTLPAAQIFSLCQFHALKLCKLGHVSYIG